MTHVKWSERRVFAMQANTSWSIPAAAECFVSSVTINNEDTLRPYSLTDALDVLYQLARENCLSPQQMYVIRVGLLRSDVLHRGDVRRGRARGFICIEPRAKHQLRCGNDLALAALSRSVFPFLPLLPPVSPRSTYDRVHRRSPSRRCGKNYRIFSDASTRLAERRTVRVRWY